MICERPMEASAGLVAGSHNRNELVVIRRDGESGVSCCQICSCFKCFLPALFLFFITLILPSVDNVMVMNL